MRAATVLMSAGSCWILALCAACRTRRMMPSSWKVCLRCEESRSRRASAERSPCVEVPALRLLREARGLTVAGLARCAGVDYTTVMRLEGRGRAANRQRAQRKTAERLADALGVGVRELSGCRARRAV